VTDANDIEQLWSLGRTGTSRVIEVLWWFVISQRSGDFAY
jgi:hypothetical protein